MGNNDHHAAPEQIGEDIPKGAVKHAQRNAEQGGKQGLAACKTPFLCGGKPVLQKIKKKSRWPPSQTPTHKRPAAFQKIKADTASSRETEGEAAVKTGQQEIRLCPAFQIPDAAQAEAQQGNDEL